MINDRTHIDLFSGIGGFALAARWAGVRTIAFCEKDEWARQVLQKHWPEVPIHNDIKEFPSEQYNRPWLVTGGFPCQSFSQCGKRRGVDDDRFLWPAMFKVIESVKPDWAICENVVGIVKMALPLVVSDLESIGYECAVLLIPASGVGAPHRRRRVWIVAKPLHPHADGLRPHRAEMHEHGEGDGVELQHQQVGQPGSLVPQSIWEGVDPRIQRMVDGLPNRVDGHRKERIRGVGNAIVPQVAYELIMNMILTENQERNKSPSNQVVE